MPGERIRADRNAVDLPEDFRSTAVPNTTYAFQFAGLAILTRGPVVFDLRSVAGGLLLVQCAKVWFIDRMVLPFRTMAERDPRYASCEYRPAPAGDPSSSPGSPVPPPVCR